MQMMITRCVRCVVVFLSRKYLKNKESECNCLYLKVKCLITVEDQDKASQLVTESFH